MYCLFHAQPMLSVLTGVLWLCGSMVITGNVLSVLLEQQWCCLNQAPGLVGWASMQFPISGELHWWVWDGWEPMQNVARKTATNLILGAHMYPWHLVQIEIKQDPEIETQTDLQPICFWRLVGNVPWILSREAIPCQKGAAINKFRETIDKEVTI